MLPELREAWWETGTRRRAEVAVSGIFAELPRLAAHAVVVAWRADRVRTLLVALATLGAGTMSTFGLLSTQRVLVELFGAGPTPDRVRAAVPALIVLGGIAVVRGTLAITVGYAMTGLEPLVKQASERRFFEATTGVRLEAFDADTFADDMERAKQAGESMSELVEGTADGLASLVNVIAVAVALLFINPLLLVALLVASAPKTYAAMRAGHLRYATYVASSVRRRRMYVLERQMADRESAPELRTYDLRGFLLHQYDMVMRAQSAVELGLARRIAVTSAVGAVVGGVGLALVWVLLGWLLATDRIPLSAAVTCVLAVQAAQLGLAHLTFQLDYVYTSGQYVQEYLTFLERADAYLPEQTGPERPPAGPLQHLEIRAVHLQYPERPAPAVDNVSFTITAGQTIALVGENGSGKSTLAAMVAGLRRPTSGTFLWNGKPYDAWDPASLRGRVGVVLQDHHKWPYSAAANIAMGNLSADTDQARIELAAGRALAHEMILDLPHGYRTLLDRTFKEGQDLSGGQWQRITAARGFYRDADLLIMDEPSSALDPRAEDALFQDLRARQGVRTTILITHRLANVMHADVIYVMHEGVVTETGTHTQLIELGGRYAELFRLQAAGYGK
ncbi:ABC transporter ATP-binding protein [Kineosporia mesophila]|uniref:ABC transporter ATP-binding protein n=1 Tax=Kineosporia mesophila TaxID=566012 RepID=A0ABP6YYI9_9ACTN|nr:ABC transporter ATP-binding protein/permease [Kineosporia mesophila]